MENSDVSRHKLLEKKWYVFYVKAKHEKKLAELLKRDNYEFYLPIIEVVKQWADRRKKIEEPLFKSYIFVRLEKSQIYNVLQYPSVVSNVKFAGNAAVINDSQIELIKKLIFDKTEFVIANDKVNIGDVVKITSGKFKGQEGVIKEIRGKRKLYLFLESINFFLEIKID